MALLARSSASKEAELLIRRQEVAVLRLGVPKTYATWEDAMSSASRLRLVFDGRLKGLGWTAGMIVTFWA